MINILAMINCSRSTNVCEWWRTIDWYPIHDPIQSNSWLGSGSTTLTKVMLLLKMMIMVWFYNYFVYCGALHNICFISPLLMEIMCKWLCTLCAVLCKTITITYVNLLFFIFLGVFCYMLECGGGDLRLFRLKSITERNSSSSFQFKGVQCG